LGAIATDIRDIKNIKQDSVLASALSFPKFKKTMQYAGPRSNGSRTTVYTFPRITKAGFFPYFPPFRQAVLSPVLPRNLYARW
jgi:hypothetical protein